MTERPSNDHCGELTTLPGSERIRVASPPVAEVNQISSGSPTSRLRTKRTYSPSGENSGPQSWAMGGGSVSR
jgi:hypothetical protein